MSMGVIDNICEFDPQYREKLDNHLLTEVPNLAKAERILLEKHLRGIPCQEMTVEECIGTVVRATDSVQSFEVVMEELDPETGEVSVGGDSKRFVWDRINIVKDRFSYLSEALASLG